MTKSKPSPYATLTPRLSHWQKKQYVMVKARSWCEFWFFDLGDLWFKSSYFQSEHIPSSVKEEDLLRRAIFLNVVMCVQDFSQNVWRKYWFSMFNIITTIITQSRLVTRLKPLWVPGMSSMKRGHCHYKGSFHFPSRNMIKCYLETRCSKRSLPLFNLFVWQCSTFWNLIWS